LPKGLQSKNWGKVNVNIASGYSYETSEDKPAFDEKPFVTDLERHFEKNEKNITREVSVGESYPVKGDKDAYFYVKKVNSVNNVDYNGVTIGRQSEYLYYTKNQNGLAGEKKLVTKTQTYYEV
jgi:hypothetical protein